MASSTSSLGSSNPSAPFGLANGTPIPEKFTRVPKDQQALLNHKDSWISAMKRRPNQGTVNMPPKALENITYSHTSRTLPPAAQKPSALGSNGLAEAEPAALTTPSHGQDNGNHSSSNPGTPTSSWSESPQRSPHTPRRQHITPSPAPSIRSQVATERPSGASKFPSQFPPPDHPSSPQIASSPPVQSATKRQIPTVVGSKRRPIEAFPSSSAGVEEELETAIPDALLEATPPVNRMAAHLATTSQAVTSPPCGQGSMIPSTYKDAKSPEVKAEGPNKKRRMKSIKFDSSPQERPAESGFLAKTLTRPTVLLSASQEESLPTSSASLIASTLPIADARPSLVAPCVARDISGLGRAAANDQQVGTTSRPGLSAPKPTHVAEDEVMTGTSISSGTRQAGADDGSFNQSTRNARSQQILTYLDSEWGREGHDWLPPTLRHFRSTLTYRSLETLQKITSMAIKNGTRLSRLWSESDGILHRATLHQTNGKLVFPEELVHMTFDLYGTEIAGTTSHRARGAEEVTKGSSRPASRRESLTQARVSNPSPPESPAAAQAAQDAFVSQVVGTHQRRFEKIPQPPREVTGKTFAQAPLEAFRSAYPSYSGSIGDFVKACLTIKDLRRKLLLPKWLYDDFIRAFVDGFVPYIETLDDDDEPPLSAYQWYVEHVDRPTFEGGIVTRENLHLVFKVYHSEFKSAKESVLAKTSPNLGAGQMPSFDKGELQLEKGPQATIAQTIEPTEARPSGGLSLLPNQPSSVTAQEANKGPANGRFASIKVKDHGPLSMASRASLAEGDKGKQRLPIKEHSILWDAPASAPAIQRHRNALPRDEDVAFISSTPRPRTANPDDARALEDNDRIHDDRFFGTIPTTQTTFRKPMLPERKDSIPARLDRNDIVAETPTRRSAAPAKTLTEHPVVRRSLPISFTPTTPSASLPSAESLRGGTPKSTLSDNRVKKPKNETEEERKKRKMRAKLEKMAKEGRLALPPSSMAPKS
ncbi:hypothetical protein CTA2_5983 [Colletotrichum tanaceti]|uniref:Uncharacterized protein n=1 Tax=Colletotrichum tanaceti TaxID=1306861 RepID=A0A4U6XU82_9PEZI|nr:hypothetical protein CTA2_5983 [Colletotrichum tanaceti]TKW59535.1 hypothetical protein CTA1_4222 [Colletotrichum tanaceti]